MSNLSPNLPNDATDSYSAPWVVRVPEVRKETEDSPKIIRPEAPRRAAPAPVEFATTNIWDIPFARITMDECLALLGQIIDRRVPSYAITANLHYAMLHSQDPEIRSVTREAAMIIADGMPIVWRSRMDKQPLPERVAGSDLIYLLASQAAKRGDRLFLLGAAPGIAHMAAEKLKETYPGLQIAGAYSPPFRKPTEAEHFEMIDMIKASRPDILLVAFGQPKGEKWIAHNFERIGAPLAIQLGASFDFIAGTSQRAPLIWQKTGLEWAYRLIKEPKRLGPRYLQNGLFLAKRLTIDGYRALRSWTETP